MKAQWKSKGQRLNHKRVQQIWSKSGWQVPQRPKKRKIVMGRTVSTLASHPNHVWSYDFQCDALVSGRKTRLLNTLDEFTHEWLSVSVGVSLTSQAVLKALEALLVLWHSLLRSQRYAVMTSSAYNGSAPHYPNKASY